MGAGPGPAEALRPTPWRGVGRVRDWSAALPLRWRLALGYALVLLLVLAPIAVLQAVAVHTLLVQDASGALQARARAEVATAGKGAGKPRSSSALQAVSRLAQAAAGQGLVAVVVNANGQVLGASAPAGEQAPAAVSLIDVSMVRQALLGRTDAAYQAPTPLGPYLVAVAALPGGKAHAPPGNRPPAPLPPPATPRGALVLAESLAPIERTTTRIWLLTLAGTALALLLAAALGALLARRALRPLTRIAAAAGAMAAGDYARRVPVPPARDEVGRLAMSFNTMAAAVDDAFTTQRRFVADAAHELRTPLTALRGYADVLLMGAASDPADLATALEEMRGEAARMTRLVNDLLALARLDAAGAGAHFAEVDLTALLREVGNGLRLLHADRRITLELPDRPVIVRGDDDRLCQVVTNLADNAVKFTEPNGCIGLRLHQEGSAVRLAICDDGAGIAPQDLPRVCERFFRVDKARSRASGGAGLGLAIVQAIAVAHGGSLALESVLGRGTTATVWLPCPDKPVAAAVAHLPRHG